jgi:hypothetical protein
VLVAVACQLLSFSLTDIPLPLSNQVQCTELWNCSASSDYLLSRHTAGAHLRILSNRAFPLFQAFLCFAGIPIPRCLSGRPGAVHGAVPQIPAGGPGQQPPLQAGAALRVPAAVPFCADAAAGNPPAGRADAERAHDGTQISLHLITRALCFLLRF